MCHLLIAAQMMKKNTARKQPPKKPVRAPSKLQRVAKKPTMPNMKGRKKRMTPLPESDLVM